MGFFDFLKAKKESKKTAPIVVQQPVEHRKTTREIIDEANRVIAESDKSRKEMMEYYAKKTKAAGENLSKSNEASENAKMTVKENEPKPTFENPKMEITNCYDIVYETNTKIVNILSTKSYKVIKTKVVGVSYKNGNGSSRQGYIEDLDAGDKLLIKREEYKGKPAYAVFSDEKKQIGYISQDLADKLATEYKDMPLSAVVREIKGGKHKIDNDDEFEGEDDTEDDSTYNSSYGCNINLIIKKNNTKKEEDRIKTTQKIRVAKPSTPKPKEKPECKSYRTNIVGTSFNNEDGSSRQSHISELKKYDILLIHRYDFEGSPAYGVFTVEGKQIGGLKQEVANEIATEYSNYKASGEVEYISDGDDGKPSSVIIDVMLYRDEIQIDIETEIQQNIERKEALDKSRKELMQAMKEYTNRSPKS